MQNERGLSETGVQRTIWGRGGPHISVDHRQRVTHEVPVPLDNHGFQVASDTIQKMHILNKTLLQDILARDMLVRIGLGSDS